MTIFEKAWAWLRSLFGGSSTPPPNPPFAGPIPGPWSLTQGSAPGPLTGNALAFPIAPSASTAWASYVEAPLAVVLNGAQTLEITYTISGAAPVFVHDSPSNTPDGPSTLRLLLHRAGDNLSGVGPMAFYRWFSNTTVPLALGTFTISVPLTPDKWIGTNGLTDAVSFAAALANIASVGFVFGGGYFAGHGVGVSSGSASLTINSASIK